MPAIADSRILIMATSGFEESELFGPRRLFIERGADVRVASPDLAAIQATVRDDPGRTIRPDMRIADVDPEQFDALILPGGVINPDALRTYAEAIALIRRFVELARPVAAICHGPWLLVEAGVLRGRRAACWPSIRTDLRNAGAIVSDEAVAVDGAIVTARGPDDIVPFTIAVMNLIEAKAPPA